MQEDSDEEDLSQSGFGNKRRREKISPQSAGSQTKRQQFAGYNTSKEMGIKEKCLLFS